MIEQIPGQAVGKLRTKTEAVTRGVHPLAGHLVPGDPGDGIEAPARLARLRDVGRAVCDRGFECDGDGYQRRRNPTMR